MGRCPIPHGITHQRGQSDHRKARPSGRGKHSLNSDGLARQPQRRPLQAKQKRSSCVAFLPHVVLAGGTKTTRWWRAPSTKHHKQQLQEAFPAPNLGSATHVSMKVRRPPPPPPPQTPTDRHSPLCKSSYSSICTDRHKAGASCGCTGSDGQETSRARQPGQHARSLAANARRCPCYPPVVGPLREW